MKKLVIHYQTNRAPNEDSFHYPEDFRTPKQRVEFVENCSKLNSLPDNLIITSTCPYIIEGFVEYFRDRELEAYIDSTFVDIELVFKELADPMKKINRLIFKL